jgi:hypothetical protein
MCLGNSSLEVVGVSLTTLEITCCLYDFSFLVSELFCFVRWEMFPGACNWTFVVAFECTMPASRLLWCNLVQFETCS